MDETYARQHGYLSTGSVRHARVTDTGVGMDAETQSHIFEPFFTTKDRGKGTGLGLATVYGVIKQSNGFIWVYSEPGHGATFKVLLPRVKAPVPSASANTKFQEVWRGSQTILLVEDDDSLRDLTRDLLVNCGYTVLEASNGPRRAADCPAKISWPDPSLVNRCRNATCERPSIGVPNSPPFTRMQKCSLCLATRSSRLATIRFLNRNGLSCKSLSQSEISRAKFEKP